MQVSGNTKISHILRENKDAIDTIASINKHFKKLKNPVLRKVLAPRVTVKDAAKIGNVSVNEFLKKLESIGFEAIYDDETKTESAPKSDNPKLDQTRIVVLDVRPIINSGGDPFSKIMDTIKTLKDDETLKIINIFEPTPLIGILEGKGYKIWTEEIDVDEYHTFFTKEARSSHQEIVAEMPLAEGSFEDKLASFGGNLKEIDVRHLEMPEPMVTILSELESLPDKHVLLVNHKKMPQFLLPELKNRNYKVMSKDIEEGFLQLIIYND
ncbi:MAG: DUF2249 domain-containing protein [Bacteroidota bacterium]